MGIVVLILLVIGALIVLSVLTQITFGLILPLIVWALTGWLAGRILGERDSNLLRNILMGLLGGIVGGILFNPVGLIGQLIFGTIGAILVIVVFNFINNRPRTV